MIGTLDATRREATVVGGGIAGLLAACALDKKGYRVTLLEERERAGGWIQTRRTDEPGGTLLTALLGKAFKRPAQNGHGLRDADDAHKTKRQRKRMVAPLRGMGALTESLERRLEQRLGARFRRGVRVSGLPDAPNVVLTTPTCAAAALLQTEAPELSWRLREVQYTPLVSVTAFVERASFTRPVRGVGVLVPARGARLFRHTLQLKRVRRSGLIRELYGTGQPARDDRTGVGDGLAAHALRAGRAGRVVSSSYGRRNVRVCSSPLIFV